MKANLLTTAILLLQLVACKPVIHEYKKISGYTQGTTYHITYENSVNKDLSTTIDSILKEIDLSLSEYIPNSIISRINRNDTSTEISPMFRAVIEKSAIVNQASAGAFDITVGPLVDAWGFGPKGHKFARKSQIDSLLGFIGMDKIEIKGSKLIKKFPQVDIDVNAIAQGYSVDVVSNFLELKGIENYIVEIGGEVRAKGINSKGETWKVGIDKPIDGNSNPGEQIQAAILLKDKSVSTSGNYRKFYIENGVKYAHHIDPHTGYPTQNCLLSASLFADECAMADANATACLVLGLEKSKEYLSKHKELDALLIYSNEKGEFCTYMTEGAKKMFVK